MSIKPMNVAETIERINAFTATADELLAIDKGKCISYFFDIPDCIYYEIVGKVSSIIGDTEFTVPELEAALGFVFSKVHEIS